MTRAQLITALWLVTVICLGSAALLVPERGTGAMASVPLVGFPPSDVTGVEVGLADGTTHRLVRAGPDRWEILLPAGEGQTRWPASAERVRAFLRILGRTRGVPTPDGGSDAATTVVITSGGGDRVSLGLPSSTVGGRAIIRAMPGEGVAASYVTTDELPRLLTGRGLLHWLDTRPFAGAVGQVERVTVSSLGGTMTIARAGGSWRIEAPFAATAEPALVDELIAGLRTMAMTDPTTGPPAAPADATTITLETSVRSADADRAVTESAAAHTLSTLGPVAESGRVAIRAASRSDDGSNTAGPVGGNMLASDLADLVRTPSFYIARRVSRAQAADVRGLSLTLPDGGVIEVVRTESGWARAGSPIGESEAEAIDDLVELLTTTNAVQASHAPGPAEGGQHLAAIEARGLGGLTILSADLGVAPLPGGGEAARAHALVRVGEIARFYAPEPAVEAVRWVAGLRSDP